MTHTNFHNAHCDQSHAKYFFVGDGSEAIDVESVEAVAQQTATELNRKHDTTEYCVYSVDLDETDADGHYVFPHERALVQKHFG